MRTIALLTGRGNNTLPDKNVLNILGHPVLYYPARAAKNTAGINDWFCSSDDKKILAAAEKEGYKKIVRPPELAKPTSLHVDCIMHALSEIEKNGERPDVCVVLLANNVTVKSAWIAECIKLMEKKPSVTAVVPVYKDNDHHPLRAKSLNEAGFLEMYEKNIPSNISTNRQDLSPCFFLAHNFWVLRVSYLLAGYSNGQPPWTFMGNEILPYYIEESIDIHDEIDLELAKNWLQQNYDD